MPLSTDKNFLPIFVYDSSFMSIEKRLIYGLNPYIYTPLYYITSEDNPFSATFFRYINIAYILRRYPLIIQTAEVDFDTKRELLTGLVEKFPKGGVFLDTQLGAIPFEKERAEGLAKINNSWLFTELETCDPEAMSDCLECVCNEFLDMKRQNMEIQHEVVERNR